MIAIFWSDVDTRPEDGGTVWYRETSNTMLLTRFQNEIQSAFQGQRDFVPISLFIATWDHVGYFSRGTDRVRMLTYSYKAL